MAKDAIQDLRRRANVPNPVGSAAPLIALAAINMVAFLVDVFLLDYYDVFENLGFRAKEASAFSVTSTLNAGPPFVGRKMKRTSA